MTPSTPPTTPVPPTPTTSPQKTGPQAGDAYCGNCGYILTGLTEASKCPECGRPIVEVLTRKPFKRLGKSIRYRSATQMFGLPLIHVAIGPDPERGEAKGKARGIIAVGDIAVGGIAVGGVSLGVVSVGGMSVGVASLGGMSVGALTALGGCSVGGFAVGGGAVGGIAAGGMAIGAVAQGGVAIGVYARGGRPIGPYLVSGTRQDPQAVKVFDTLSPLLGSSTGWGAFQFTGGFIANLSITVLLALAIVMAAIVKHRTTRRKGV